MSSNKLNCGICGKRLQRPDRNKFCSRKCFHKAQEKPQRHCYGCNQYKLKDQFYWYGNRYHSLCKICHGEQTKKWHEKNKDKVKISDRRAADKIRMEVLMHYSKGKLECACCVENLYEFLSLDHINGGGNKERMKLKSRGGKVYYHWIKKQGFPKNMQVLCYNCNLAKGYYGICPHKIKN